jgi:hypothetical protein
MRLRFSGILFGIACSLTAAQAARGETYYVRAAGNDQADGKTAQTAFRSVLRAAQVLNHGDHVLIGPGSYAGTAFFAERWSADGRDMSLLGDETGRQTGDPPGPVVLAAASPTEPALGFHRFRGLTISGLTFRGSGQGLKLEKCQRVIVQRCTFDGPSRGLVASGVEGLRVESCVLVRTTIGMFFQNSVGVRVAHVSVAGSSSVGILALGCGSGEVRNSLFAENNTNLVADAVSAAAWTSDHNVIHGTNGPWGDVPFASNVYEWFSASGQDRHSVYVLPAFADPEKYDLHPSAAVSWPGGLPGMSVGKVLEPKVELDRDGRPLRVRQGTVSAGAYDYPDPQTPPGWLRLPLRLEGPRVPGTIEDGRGWRQSAAVYAEDGTLVRTLLADAAGASELWWDGLDDQGAVAPAGKYQVKAVCHDVRIADDGAVGDNGSPLGAFNPDNADRVVALPDGGFIASAVYDEAGYPLRRFSAAGQPIFAATLAGTYQVPAVWRDDEKRGQSPFVQSTLRAVPANGDRVPSGCLFSGDNLWAVMDKGASMKLVRLLLPGERAHMPNGAEHYSILAPGEAAAEVAGMAVTGKNAYLALTKPNVSGTLRVPPPASGYPNGTRSVPDTVVRVIDLASGRKMADWPVAEVADIAADEKGRLWVISGKDVLVLGPGGGVERRFASGLEKPQYLAVGTNRLAVVDRTAAKVAILDVASGRAVRMLAGPRVAGQFMPVRGEMFGDPRGAAFLSDGRLAVTDGGRIRLLWPDSGQASQDILSNFMDSVVPHPAKPEYLYCYPGVFRADTASGAWEWLLETPHGLMRAGPQGKPVPDRLGSPSTSVVLGGRSYIAYYGEGRLRMIDVTEPLRPRMALDVTDKVLNAWAYATICFTKGGNLVCGGNYNLRFQVVPFKSLNAENNPIFDFAHPQNLGPEKDPQPRDMKCIGALAGDRVTGDQYYLAVTSRYNKMVPAWGADGTGVGRSAPDGRPLWFALSSGGNYMSISALDDGRNAWIMAGKSFGGQIDLFDADGLRLTTGNWSWPCSYKIGFVDLRFGVQAYLRPDGRPGAYVEDDAIGRFARARVDGAETLRRTAAGFSWSPAGTAGGEPPLAGVVRGKSLAKTLVIPRVAPLPADGDWAAWQKAGIVPQIVALPCLGFTRAAPDDLWQTFRAGTALGALAHDGQNLYAYFLATDDTPHFDSAAGGNMWEFDCVELWLEEEQFALGLTAAGTPMVFKNRYHDRAGKEWSANYPLPRENAWAARLDDLSQHPLGRQLAAITGVSMQGKKGYAVMGKIPFIEVKLVGGIAGRGGKDIVDMTGKAGEAVRVALYLSNVTAWGHSQDFKVQWPSAAMFSDPSRSAVFVLGK